jgi:predicted ATPase
MHDVVGYLNHIEDPNEVWESELMLYSYDLIFLLKPVSQIYVNDEDRMETFEEAVEVHKSLEKTYQQSKLKIIKLPFTTLQERFNLILKHCANEFS